MTANCCHRPHHARGLCLPHYLKARRNNQLDDHERTKRPATETLNEWLRLRADGYTIPNAASRLGMTPAALERAIDRTRAPRAIGSTRKAASS